MSSFRANSLADQVAKNEFFEIDTLPAHLKVILIGRLADSLAVDHRTMRDAFWGPERAPDALPRLDTPVNAPDNFRRGLNLATEDA
jgi:hypothetical protein